MSLKLDNVRKVVGGEVHLDGIDLELEPGRLYVLLGPTLAGKTSLMRIMAGLDRPTRGKVFAGGKNVTGTSVRKRNVAMVYQQFINYPSFTVYDNIASPLRIKGLSKADVDARVRETAELVRIERFLDRMPSELSGGQQQRCAIARALVKRADLLLLDEPLVNLDYKLREELRVELQNLFHERETTVVYATTEPLEALIMGGEAIVMGEGRVLQTGETASVYHRPGTVGVARTFSDPPMNIYTSERRADALLVGTVMDLPPVGHLKDIPKGGCSLGVRANHLSLTRRGPADVETQATVEMAEVSGSETFVHARKGQDHVVVQEEGVHAHEPGSTVTIFADPARFYAFDEEGALIAAPDRHAVAG